MNSREVMRRYVRKMLMETVNNFAEKEEETSTIELKDGSKPQVFGDSLNVKLNQKANELGSDEKNSPTVSVSPGKRKGGKDYLTGQLQANFQNKTKQA